jgi:hypothetical protein
MRIQIKTQTPIRDPDIRACYLIAHAMKIATPRMRQANLDFVLNRDWNEFNRRLSRSEQPAETSNQK